MTQFISHTEGKTYALEHLLPFDLELAKQGHPCAFADGEEASHIIPHYKEEYLNCRVWRVGEWRMLIGTDEDLRLAPLAIKDGKPLHVGDLLQIKVVMFGGDGWRDEAVTMNNWNRINTYGRWPVENK